MIQTEPYVDQVARWPKAGRHLLAQFDDASVVVYQAFKPSIGLFAAKNGFLGGEFSLSRMSWIKTSFLWMMHRSDWGTKRDQEVTLAVRIRRDAFDSILAQAVPSSFGAARHLFPSETDWRTAVARSAVRLQWDPDHDPTGAPEERRAIQLGLRGRALEAYAREWIVSIDDLSTFVHEARQTLVTPSERLYPFSEALAKRLSIE